MISKLEVLNQSEKIRNYQNKFVLEISKRIQSKIKSQQVYSDCEYSKKLIFNLKRKTPIESGLGCQLHSYASGLLCANENKRKFLIVNYDQKQFSDYFNNFLGSCEEDKYLSIQENINRNTIKNLSKYLNIIL